MSEPEWTAPLCPLVPEPNWRVVGDRVYWTLDWRRWLQRGAMIWHPEHMAGQLRGFHLVFRIQVRTDGDLLFWADDGCIIRRDQRVLYENRHTGPQFGKIPVRAGEILEIAQWQRSHEWFWGAQYSDAVGTELPDRYAVFSPYHEIIANRMNNPNGPSLKIFCDGKHPIRTALAVHSMLINGYAPPEVLLYGEGQWSDDARSYFTSILPFARIVSDDEVREAVGTLGEAGRKLAQLSREHFFVMKLCVALFHAPYEHCLMDDDVFILKPVEEALAAFLKHDLVYQSDTNNGPHYIEMWKHLWAQGAPEIITTSDFNFGQYWMRNTFDLQWVAFQVAKIAPPGHDIYRWDQGFVACLFAESQTYRLPSSRYLFPVLDGFPGGTTFGYDFENNPCGFVSIHFAGLPNKPSDIASALLARRILGPLSSNWRS